jgi:phosphate transport system substrate-binding protein
MNTDSAPSPTVFRKTQHDWMLFCLMFGLTLVGCSDKSQTSQPSGTSTQGKIVVKGSNTIGEELAPRLIAEFKKDHPTAMFELESKATGYGLAALMADQCNIAAASRPPIKDELELAKSRNIDLNDYVIGSYSVAVIVNSACPVSDLKREQVRDIFTGVIQNWKDVGGPDAPIHIHSRDPISGTAIGFKELAMENKPYASGEKTFTNYTAIAHAIGQDAGGIGYCSIELTNTPGVKTLSIGGVAPTVASINEGKYPYARVLHFYTTKGKEESSAKEFIDFVQSAKGQEIVVQTGNVPRK